MNRPPSYLGASRPHVIGIDTGRQLFVDDYLIARNSLERKWHAPRYHEACPVLRPDKPWERRGENPMAYPFSDGVWFDPEARLFKLWYYCGNQRQTGYAQSRDGVIWEKPVLNVVRGTNVAMAEVRDSTTVWMDLEDPDPTRRFKMIRVPYHENPLHLHTSPDGIRWSRSLSSSIKVHDRTTAYFDPFRGLWVLSLRADLGGGSRGRARKYYAHADIAKLLRFREERLEWWVSADDRDEPYADLGVRPELYNLDAFPYESLMVGLFSIWKGHPDTRHKINEVYLGFTRNGLEWDRPWRKPFLPVSDRPGAWNWTNVQSAGGGCLVMGDELWFYCSGRSGVPGTPRMGEAATGLAVLRRDGFVSLNAGGEGGRLKTRMLRFSGSQLFVNAAAQGGELRAAVLDSRGNTIPGYCFKQCEPMTCDSTRHRVQWAGGADLSVLRGRAVRLEFELRSAALYSFWVSATERGESGGYVAAGGPSFERSRDL